MKEWIRNLCSRWFLLQLLPIIIHDIIEHGGEWSRGSVIDSNSRQKFQSDLLQVRTKDSKRSSIAVPGAGCIRVKEYNRKKEEEKVHKKERKNNELLSDI